MDCPSCSHPVRDEEALFCARCGAPLDPEEAAVTSTLELDAEAASTTTEVPHDEIVASTGTESHEEPSADEKPEEQSVRPDLPIAEVGYSVRRRLLEGGWLDAAGAACLTFLVVVVAGLVFLIAIKLQFTGLGGSSIDALSAMVILGLASLGTPVDIGRVELSVLPLGSVPAIGWAAASAARVAVARRDLSSLQERVIEGAKLALPFAVLCSLAALIFQIRRPVDNVTADPGVALVIGALWGALFGALGGAWAHASIPHLTGLGLEQVARRSIAQRDALVAGGYMLVITAVMSSAAALIWIIVALAGGEPGRGFGAGDAAASVIYLIGFGPNVLVSIAAIALGASVDVGAAVSTGGRVIGNLTQISLFGWGGSSAPWYAFFLLLIPAFSCAWGGYWLYLRRKGSELWPALITSAAIFALVLGILAAIADARLGAGLVGDRGFGAIAPNAGAMMLLALAWGIAAGLAGWRFAETRSRRVGTDAS